jgi:UDP-N-acetylglucosamine diphosphorylase/glucosamine-1-phosphate N-acetyltransferase
VNARFAPSLAAAPESDVLAAGGRVTALRLPRTLDAGELAADGALDALVTGASRRAEIGGWWIDEVWDYLRHLVEMLDADIPAMGTTIRSGVPRDAFSVGSHPVFVERGAIVEPAVCFDASAGPILLRSGAHAQAFTRLVGPLVVGDDTIVTTDRIAASSIGNGCKVHGEVSNCIFIGHSNKGHDGFVGHSLVGRWVNLGADTITSNLKNTYGSVQLWTPGGMRDTGMQFLGTLFGDHAKTGIGMRLTTGSVIGAGANVYGTSMPPKVVAPFSWGEAGAFESYHMEKFLEVAERMMARREVVLADGVREVLLRAFAERWTVPA